MKKLIRNLILAYLILVGLKILLNHIIPAPSAYSDDYVYMKLARSFFFDFNLTIHNVEVSIYPPLYPIILSISYLFKDAQLVYFFMKVINSILSSLIIIPTFLLAREFLNEKKSLIIAIIIAILPSNFAYSSYIMSENLFYTLFLFSIYFIYRAYQDNKYKYQVLAGLFIGLSFLTRTIAIGLLAILFISYFIIMLYNKKFLFNLIKKLILISFVFILVTSPWIIFNYNIYGSIRDSFFGPYSQEAQSAITNLPTISYLVRFLISISFIILSSLIIFPLKSISFVNKNTKIFSIIYLSSIFITLIIAANHGARGEAYIFDFLRGRYIGRYTDYVLPLIFITGFIAMQKNFKKTLNKNVRIIFYLFLIIGSFLTLYSLFPINNLSLTWIGILNYLFNITFNNPKIGARLLFFSIFFVVLFSLILLLEKKKLLNKLIPYIFIFLILLNLLNYSIIYYDSKINFYDKEQMQLGLFINKIDPEISNILFDERDCGVLTKYEQDSICGGSNTKTMIGFWLNDNIIIGDVSNLNNIDYVISKHKLDLELIKKTKNQIYLYKVNSDSNLE